MNNIPWHLDWQVPRFPREEGERRHRLIRDQMRYRGLDCLIIAGNSTNFRGYELDSRYVSGFASWFDPNYVIFPLEGEPLILTFLRGHAMLAESIGFIRARSYSTGPFGRDHLGSIVKRIKELGMDRARFGIVSMRVISGWVYSGLLEEFPEAEFVDASDLIRQIRIIKSSVELEFMRRSGECADKGWAAMRDAARPGVRELEIASSCDHAMQNEGAESGPHILIGSGNWNNLSACLTLSGGARVLQQGDVILNEITPCFGGYYTQLCRPISLGTPDDDFKRLYEIHIAMYETARREFKPGALFEEIESKMKAVAMKLGKDRLAPESIWALQTCEVSDTSLSRMRGELKPGMCFVIHPFSQDAKIREGCPDFVSGHIIGDSFVVTETGHECLSKLSHEITII